MIAMARFLARASLSSSTLVSSMSSSWNHTSMADYRTLTVECLSLGKWFPSKCSTCMVLSSLAEVVSEEVSSSRQNISSWVWSAENMTWKHPNKVAQYKILKCAFPQNDIDAVNYQVDSNWTFDGDQPLSAPTAVEHQSAGSSRSSWVRSWLSWGRGGA